MSPLSEQMFVVVSRGITPWGSTRTTDLLLLFAGILLGIAFTYLGAYFTGRQQARVETAREQRARVERVCLESIDTLEVVSEKLSDAINVLMQDVSLSSNLEEVESECIKIRDAAKPLYSHAVRLSVVGHPSVANRVSALAKAATHVYALPATKNDQYYPGLGEFSEQFEWAYHDIITQMNRLFGTKEGIKTERIAHPMATQGNWRMRLAHWRARAMHQLRGMRSR